MATDFTHLKVEEETISISGSYSIIREFILEHGDRKILCIIGQAIVDNACCGSGQFIYATVPGYLIGWKEKSNEDGSQISKVEPIKDEEVRREIRKIIRETENILNIDFW